MSDNTPEVNFLDTLLEVNNLCVEFRSQYGITYALDNISFKLRKGETLGIVGESGSGKSVSALSVMRLITSPPGKITNGEIIFQSKSYGSIDLLKATESQMQDIRGNEISMIFQEPMTSLNPVFTCGYQVMEAIRLHQKVSKSEAIDRCITLFEKVKLPRPKDIFNSYPHQLSGGQKQRVMIAMAMSCNPSILIADEPTTALDVTVQATILDIMRQLRDEIDTSIIFITHDLGVIAEIADRVMVMYKGHVMEQGTVWNIFTNPKNPYTKGLLACRPKLDVKLKKLPVVSDFMVVNSEGKIEETDLQKNNSLGEILLKNYVTTDETIERRKKLKERFPILIINNLKTYFPINKGLLRKPTEFVKAVDDVSFVVYPGETLGLVGESGCGKTTLGRTILRLIEPSSGNIIFDGHLINNYSHTKMRELRKDMQIIFQDPYSSLNPRLTIGFSIMEAMKAHQIGDSDFARRKKIMELLETVGLLHQHYNRFPHEFSGGQRQRICIARALSLSPKFIICDESVSALDVSVQAQVLNLLNQLKKHFEFTYIFISHDLSVVKFMSDRIIVMNKGRIEEEGYAEDIYENPKSEYTQKLIQSIPKGELENVRFNMLRKKMHI
ncbi:MAG: ABC transporter ATP-binding protein [Cytophagales bacterium]|nr:ABC transporter ATP-binding protein [Cytophagales bacterium]